MRGQTCTRQEAREQEEELKEVEEEEEEEEKEEKMEEELEKCQLSPLCANLQKSYSDMKYG